MATCAVLHGVHVPPCSITLLNPKQEGHRWILVTASLPPPCNKAITGPCNFFYFLHFQQFAELKYIQLLNEGYHLEQNQDWEICILCLSKQNAFRYLEKKHSFSSVSHNFISPPLLFFSCFVLFCFILIPNAFKQNPNLSKANKERISSSNWSGISKVVMKHCMQRPVQCQQRTCIKMRRFTVKIWAKRLAPSLYHLTYTSLFQQ